jgi:hypothetical protein
VALRDGVDVLLDIGGVHDRREPNEPRVGVQREVINEHFERASAVAVGVFRARCIVGVPTLALRHVQHLVPSNEDELGLGVDEPLDEPGTSDTVHVGVLACHPLHRSLLP